MDPKELEQNAARVKHDIGRYVCFQQRWLGETFTFAALREALNADLLSTQRGPDGAVDVLTLWRRLAPLVPPAAFPEPAARLALDQALDALSPWVERLRGGQVADSDLGMIAEAARRVSDAAAALHLAAKEHTRHG